MHCPFLRPFFLSPEDEDRVRYRRGNHRSNSANASPTAALRRSRIFLRNFDLRPKKNALVRMPGAYGRASTASRLDAFLLPDSLKFAEYNGESPAGAGYAETLAEIFRELPVMAQFRKAIRNSQLSAQRQTARRAGDGQLPRLGRHFARHPQIAIVDWREVPTWSEFEILKARFEKMGVPTLTCRSPRSANLTEKHLRANGKKIDLVYRRVLINDIVCQPAECAALVKAYAANAVCVANNFRCKIPHVKAFFAVLTDEANGGSFLARRTRT